MGNGAREYQGARVPGRPAGDSPEDAFAAALYDARMPPAFDDAIAYAQAHETPWPRDPHVAPGPGQQPFGVHHDDPPPWNRLFGPVHERGGPAGVVWVGGREVAAWGDPERADLTFSVAKTYLALLAGVHPVAAFAVVGFGAAA